MIRGVIPYVVIMIAFTILLWFVPQLALWLPRTWWQAEMDPADLGATELTALFAKGALSPLEALDAALRAYPSG